MNEAPHHPQRRRRGRIRLLLAGACAVALTAAALTADRHRERGDADLLEPDRQQRRHLLPDVVRRPRVSVHHAELEQQLLQQLERHRGLRRRRRLEPRQHPVDHVHRQPQRESGGTNLLSLYGWSTNPLVEYYVIEDYVGSPNYSGQNMGTMTSDGGTYTIIKHQQVNQPSIQGTTTFWQYLAIRNSPRTSGTITFSNFVNAWASHGMNLGTMNYQIMATEAWGGGSGNSNVTREPGGSWRRWRRWRRWRWRWRRWRLHRDAVGRHASGTTGTTSTSSVAGSNNWTVTVNMVSPSVVYNTWNTSASWPSQYVMVAKPNGSGNNWGFTVSTNGQWTWPSVSCSSS